MIHPDEEKEQEKLKVIKTQPESQYSPLRLVGIFAMIGFCTILIIVGTFTRIKLFNCLRGIEAILHPALFPTLQSILTTKAYFYTPQVPAVLFSAALLGSACSMTAVFFYIVIGLALVPVFGLGGGFDYVLQPTFGYILAFIPAVIAANIFINKEYSVKNLLNATLAAVLTIHILGFVYVLLIALLHHNKINYIMDWLLYESLIKAVYDVIFGFMCMLLAKFCRKFIWILTAI